jgi:hypothetical protein
MELAQRVGCPPSLTFKIESDERRPSRQIANLLTRHLDIPTDQRALFLKVARQEKRSRVWKHCRLLPCRNSLTGLSRHLCQPSVLDALTQEDNCEQALERVIYVLQPPACPQEVKNRADKLRVEQEGRLTLDRSGADPGAKQ